jgi:hypothetical protein
MVAMMVVAGGLCAQEKPASEKPGADPGATTETQVDPALAKRVDDFVQFQTSLPNSVFGTNLKYQGAVPMLWHVQNPLQLISPLAPARYGDGIHNTIINPATGNQEGVKLFQVRF